MNIFVHADGGPLGLFLNLKDHNNLNTSYFSGQYLCPPVCSLTSSACKLLHEFKEFPQLLIYNSTSSNVSLTLSDSTAFSTSSVLLFISTFMLSSTALIMSYVSSITFESFIFYWACWCVHHLTTFVLRVFVSFKIVENFGIILTFITWLVLCFYFLLFFFYLINILLRIFIQNFLFYLSSFRAVKLLNWII